MAKKKISKALKKNINITAPKLPKFLETKIYKTGQTRGADDDVIFQNRVLRNSTVLIDYEYFHLFKDQNFENGFIVLIKPETYFTQNGISDSLKKLNLTLGRNLLINYSTRMEWDNFNPMKKKLKPAKNRQNPLGGDYLARVPATTSENGKKINLAFNSTGNKGAGIRVYEYASSREIALCRIQLEYLFWQCFDSIEVMTKYGMSLEDVKRRRESNLIELKKEKLDDTDKLKDSRILGNDNSTICPLCLEKISSLGFFNKVLQAEGRAVPDLTITELNLFHIEELRLGKFNHCTYNLGWGHHHCNVVVKDSGIIQTLEWMDEVVKRNNKLVGSKTHT